MCRTYEITNSDDVIDSRDIIARIEALTDELADGVTLGPLSLAEYIKETADDDAATMQDAAREWIALTKLQDDAEGYADDWQHGAQLIRGSYFIEYAQQFADDIDAVKDDSGWPGRHIDWDAAADELKQDYTEVEFDGVSYWVR